MKVFRTFLLLSIFCTISIGASAEVYQGSCGQSAQWLLDTETGLLSITGSGTMENYSSTSPAPWCEHSTDITSVTIGDQIVSIGWSAFQDCSSLTSVTIGNSVLMIGQSAFQGCSSLKSVTIPDSVVMIDQSAFQNCSGLISVTMNSVQEIGQSAFQDCSILKSVTIPDSVLKIAQSAFQNCKGLISVTIGNSVQMIGDMAFEKCGNVQELIYAEGTKTVLKTGLTSIKSVTIPDSVQEIGQYAFQDCLSLKSVTIPNSVTEIGRYAFYNCMNLESVTIPDSVQEIGVYAFDFCPGLTNVYITDLDKWAEITFLNFNANPLYDNGNLYLNEQLVTEATLTSAKTIGDNAFINYKRLTSVTIPDSVQKIGSSAFQDCSSLKSVTIPDSVQKIGSSAFLDCSSLKSVTIPDSVTEIGQNAFDYCSGLTNVYVAWKDADKIPSFVSPYFPFSTCTLYVPSGTKDLYSAKDYWKDFKSIEEGTQVSIIDKDGKSTSTFVGENSSFTFNDNIRSISVLSEVGNVSITYTRNFANADKWQGWYVPFDVPMEDMTAAGFEVAKIYGILLDKDKKTVLAFLNMDEGTVKANTPYVVRPKTSGDVTLTTKTTLHPTSDTKFTIDSAEDTYTVGGIYEQTTTPGNWYAINKEGQFQKMGTGVSLRPFRIWMTIDPRDDNPYATKAGMNMIVISRGQIYTVNGKNYLAQ